MSYHNYCNTYQSFDSDQPLDLSTTTTIKTTTTRHDNNKDVLLYVYNHNIPSSSSSGLIDDIKSFKSKSIYDWHGKDCLDWAASVCKRFNISLVTESNLSNFHMVNGRELISYGSEDFENLVCPILGSLFHREFQELAKSQFIIYTRPRSLTYIQPKQSYERFQDPYPSNVPTSVPELCPDQQYIPYGKEVVGGVDVVGVVEVPDMLKKIPTNCRRSRVRNPKSWEFLLRLLQNSQYNPSMIRWENEKTGVFKLIRKDEISKLWATREQKYKCNTGTYESFARILRYHYTTGALVPVSEKHLVYRFSEVVLKNIHEEIA